jgi:hypothetical protein
MCTPGSDVVELVVQLGLSGHVHAHDWCTHRGKTPAFFE